MQVQQRLRRLPRKASQKRMGSPGRRLDRRRPRSRSRGTDRDRGSVLAPAVAVSRAPEGVARVRERSDRGRAETGRAPVGTEEIAGRGPGIVVIVTGDRAAAKDLSHHASLLLEVVAAAEPERLLLRSKRRHKRLRLDQRWRATKERNVIPGRLG